MCPLCVLLLWGLLCPGGAVQVTIEATVGSDVSLDPIYTGDPSEISWKVDGNKLVEMEIQPLDITFYCLQDRATISPNGTLTIRGVTEEDSKMYKVEVLVNNVYQETDVTLVVLDSQVTMKKIKAAVGSDVSLVPIYTGDPSEISWKVDGSKLVDMEIQPLSIMFYRLQDRATIAPSGTLTIRGVTKEDSKQNGRYKTYKAEVLVNNVYQETEVTFGVFDPSVDAGTHGLKPGDFVMVRKSTRKGLEERYGGPFQVLVTTDTSVKLEGKSSWIRASRCKKMHQDVVDKST